MNTKKSNKKFIIILSLIIISTFLIYKVYNSNKELDSNTETYTSLSKSYAIYLEQDDGSYVLSESDSWPTDYDFNESLSNCIDSNGNILSNASISYSSGTIKVTGNTEAYCTMYFDIHVYKGYCVENGITNLSDCILITENYSEAVEDAETYIQNKGTPDFSKTATIDEGLYYAEDDYGDSYYFRGAVTDNYVYFAGYYWRIIRINGDGSIRLIYDGTSAVANGANSAKRYISIGGFNDGYASNSYMGYMYGEAFTEATPKDDILTLQNYYCYYASSYTFDPETGYYTLSEDAFQAVWNSNLVSLYTCRNSSTTCTKMYKIDSYYSNYQASVYAYSQTGEAGSYEESISTSTSTIVMATRYYYGTGYTYDANKAYSLVDYDYYVYDGTGVVSDLTGYYICANERYRSCTTLYYVKSARTAQVANVVTYSTAMNDYTTTHENKYSSKIKKAIDNWYYTNIFNKTDGTNSYDAYVSDTLFCNDRSFYYGTGIGMYSTAYGAYKRLVSNKSPILTCPQQNDAFTVNDEVYGNGDLTYKVGLITADEAAMAGGVYQKTNSNYYLTTGEIFWTMSPFYFSYSGNIGYSYEWYVYSTGSVFYAKYDSYNVTAAFRVRPVINLSSSVFLTSGDGTMDSPYQVSLS